MRSTAPDAQAQAIYNEAYTKDREFFDFWRSMQAMERGLGADSTTYVGPPTGDFFRFFNNESGTRELQQSTKIRRPDVCMDELPNSIA